MGQSVTCHFRLVLNAASRVSVEVAPAGLQHVHTPSLGGQTRFISAFSTCLWSNKVQNTN